jgi:SET domain-containing protein
MTYATRDIKKGEEIYSNYLSDFPDNGPLQMYKEVDWVKS